MGLNDTVDAMKKCLQELLHDLEKAVKGNQAAAQRVRASTIKFAKISKEYRKESLQALKNKRHF